MQYPETTVFFASPGLTDPYLTEQSWNYFADRHAINLQNIYEWNVESVPAYELEMRDIAGRYSNAQVLDLTADGYTLTVETVTRIAERDYVITFEKDWDYWPVQRYDYLVQDCNHFNHALNRFNKRVSGIVNILNADAQIAGLSDCEYVDAVITEEQVDTIPTARNTLTTEPSICVSRPLFLRLRKWSN
jgi:hypothetical protein